MYQGEHNKETLQFELWDFHLL